MPARVRICRPPLSNSATTRPHWLEDYALFRALKARYSGAHYLEWPAELVQRAPARAGAGPTRTGEPNRSGPPCPVPAVPTGGAPEGACAGPGRADDR